MHGILARTQAWLGTLRRTAVGGTVLALFALACWSGQSLAQDGPAAPATESAPVAASAESGSPADAAGADDHVPTGFFEIVFSGGLLGIAFVVALFALSAMAVYLIVEQSLVLRRSVILPPGLADEASEAIRSGQVGLARQLCVDRPSVLAFVIAKGLEEVDSGWPSMEKSMEDALAEQSARLFRKIEYLTAIGNIAPMIGLLGTVVGMIFAFQQVALSRGSAGAGDLAEGIYQALITTVGGLLIAIPALGAFAVLRNRVDQLVAEVAYEALHVVRPLKRRNPGGGPAVASAPAPVSSPKPIVPSGPQAPPPPPGR
ncbi:MAG TPA: MotA/TolQ/ExbB proton channel family protein [Pirellulaceae bacterium]|nr:MotA/TolQ/ExbB proton channel family protein [Pirellulaceae bacterium]